MLNTSSCTTRHLTLSFPSVTPAVTTEQDYNFSSLYGDLYPSDNCSINGEMSVLDEFFPQDLFNNSHFSLNSDRSSGHYKRKEEGFDTLKGQPPQIRDISSPDSLSQNPEKSVDAIACGNGCASSNDGLESFNDSTNNNRNNSNNINNDANNSPGFCKHSSENSMLTMTGHVSSDPDNRKGTHGGVITAPRGKGRPVKSAQSLPTSTGCKPVIQCFTCHKTFNNSSALAKHKLIHSDDRKYSCVICSKSFKRQDHLHGHMMTHSAKKPYECCFSSCDKSYCDARSLRRHHENHHFQLLDNNNHRDFPISSSDGKAFDPSAFKDSNHWTTGFNPLDEPKPVMCSVCGKRFRNLPALNGHMRLHGGYMKQIKSEVTEISDVEKDAISDAQDTSCASLSSEETNDQPATKNDNFNNMSNFMSGVTNIKQELSSEQHYWNNNNNNNNNGIHNWCKNDIKYPNTIPPLLSSSCSNDSTLNPYFHSMENNQDQRCEPRPNASCFYSTGQSAFQTETANSNLVQTNVPPSLSSPCLAVSPPSTPGHLKPCYNNANYKTKFFRRNPNIVNTTFVTNKCQQNLQRTQNHHPHSTNLHRTTSAVFPQGPPHSPFSSNNNYTPASATTSNFFQFPSSYEDVSPPTSQNHGHLPYTHQFPSTSPFLNIQSRPKTPFTPSTPGRSCRQFYYNPGEDSPVTPNMRGYGHKTLAYHPYHSNYRYYNQLKHHNPVQNFPNIDSEFNKCLEMMEKGNIDNMNQSNSGNMTGGPVQRFSTNHKQVDNLMDFSPGDGLASGVMDLNCMVEEAAGYCPSMDQNPSSQWSSATNQSSQVADNYVMGDPAGENELQNYHGSSSFRITQDMKSCFNNLTPRLTNNSSFKDAVSNNQINQFAMNSYDFTCAQNNQSSFVNAMHSDVNHHQLSSLPIDPSVATNGKRKKKHKPEPLWIPANVSNFSNTGGCFMDQSSDCDRPIMPNCRKKAPPPPYVSATPISACNLPLDLQGDPTNQHPPNSAPPFHDFSLNLGDNINSGLNDF